MSLGIQFRAYTNDAGPPGGGFASFQHDVAAVHLVAVAITATGAAAACDWDIYVDSAFITSTSATNNATVTIDGRPCVVTLIDNTELTDSFLIDDVIEYKFTPIA